MLTYLRAPKFSFQNGECFTERLQSSELNDSLQIPVKHLNSMKIDSEKLRGAVIYLDQVKVPSCSSRHGSACILNNVFNGLHATPMMRCLPSSGDSEQAYYKRAHTSQLGRRTCQQCLPVRAQTSPQTPFLTRTCNEQTGKTVRYTNLMRAATVPTYKSPEYLSSLVTVVTAF